jgi:transposase InsO family protein
MQIVHYSRLLAAEGCKIGRRLMRRMGIEALYRRPRTTKPEPGHKIYPYLLRGMAITRPNQVWAMSTSGSSPSGRASCQAASRPGISASDEGVVMFFMALLSFADSTPRA